MVLRKVEHLLHYRTYQILSDYTALKGKMPINSSQESVEDVSPIKRPER